MLVGDSMNRNQFESMLCVLREGLSDKSRMYEVHGHNITKGRGYFVFKFEVSPLFYSQLPVFSVELFTGILVICTTICCYFYSVLIFLYGLSGFLS